jgi:hypothetical protein
VNTGARVVLPRRDVLDGPAGAPPDHDVAAGLGGTLLDPIDVVTVQLDLPEADNARDDGIRRNRRAP